jgi:hypothetical protein
VQGGSLASGPLQGTCGLGAGRLAAGYGTATWPRLPDQASERAFGDGDVAARHRQRAVWG